ncbi:hypothetical protein DBV15_08524, partial [Temnothorax longispinosus]
FDSGFLWNVFLNVFVNVQYLLRRILFRRNYYISPYIPVIVSNIVLSRQVVCKCHHQEIFHVHLISVLLLFLCVLLID